MRPHTTPVCGKSSYIDPLFMNCSVNSDFDSVFTVHISLFHENTLFHLEPHEVCFERIMRAVLIAAGAKPGEGILEEESCRRHLGRPGRGILAGESCL